MGLMAGIERVAVVGSGTMGRQIALQIAAHGVPVAMYDAVPEMLAQAEAAQRAIFATWAATGQPPTTDEAAVFGRLRYEGDLGAALGGADLVIEAVPERVEL